MSDESVICHGRVAEPKQYSKMKASPFSHPSEEACSGLISFCPLEPNCYPCMIDHWIAALFFHNYQYTIQYFLYLPYVWRLLTKFLWGIFTYVLFISSLLQLIVRNWVVLMEFAGHVMLLLFSSKMYIVLVIGSLVQKLENNFNLASYQFSTTNKNDFSNILAIKHVW